MHYEEIRSAVEALSVRVRSMWRLTVLRSPTGSRLQSALTQEAIAMCMHVAVKELIKTA